MSRSGLPDIRRRAKISEPASPALAADAGFLS
jgi:hypothetical protein